MTDLTGQTLINRYFMRQHIGAGGMADVYLAWDNVRSAKMALKVLRRDLIHNPHFLQMFAKEAEMLRKLEHPNIVRLYDFERKGDLAFIVMDWVEGTNLRQAIMERRGPYNAEETSLVLLPVCSALNYAHQNRVYHCDVKPANILLDDNGKVLLTDFGVARIAAEEARGGTPAYMAPEQFTGNSIDGRTDVYALGVMLFEMLTGGELPFRGESTSTSGTTSRDRIAWEHVHQPAPSPRGINSGIAPTLENIVLTALEKEPSMRYPTPMSLREAFENACSLKAQKTIKPGANVHPISPARFPHPQKPVRSRYPTKPVEKGPYLYCRSGELTGSMIVIPRDGLTIGRGSSNQIRLKERSISRRHSTITITRQGTYIRDENSRLGTYLNESRILKSTALKHGDIIRIGYYQILEYRDN
jgi:serine/threonine protein kinase